MNEQLQIFDAAVPHPSTSANALTLSVMRYIRNRGGQAERISVVGRPLTTFQGGREIITGWAKSHMTVGTADISATIKGRSVKIEVKVGSDAQSPAQRAYQREVEAAGGLYYIARDMDNFVQWYQSLWGGR